METQIFFDQTTFINHKDTELKIVLKLSNPPNKHNISVIKIEKPILKPQPVPQQTLQLAPKPT